MGEGDAALSKVLGPLPPIDHSKRLVLEGYSSFIPTDEANNLFNIPKLAAEFSTWEREAVELGLGLANVITPPELTGEIRSAYSHAFAAAIQERARLLHRGFQSYLDTRSGPMSQVDIEAERDLRFMRRGLRSEKALIAAMWLNAKGEKIDPKIVVPWFFYQQDRETLKRIPGSEVFLTPALDFSYFLRAQRDGIKPADVVSFINEHIEDIDIGERYKGEFNRVRKMDQMVFGKHSGLPIVMGELAIGTGRMARIHAQALLDNNPDSVFVGADISQKVLEIAREDY